MPRAVCAVHTGMRRHPKILDAPFWYSWFLVLHNFSLPFQHDLPIQNEVLDKCLGVMRDRYNFYWPRGGLALIGLPGPHRFVPKRVHHLSASLDVYVAFQLLTTRIKLLDTDEVGHIPIVWVVSKSYNTYSTLSALAGKRPSDTSCSTDAKPLCSKYTCQNTVCYIRDYCFSSALHMSRSISCAHKLISYLKCCVCGSRNTLVTWNADYIPRRGFWRWKKRTEVAIQSLHVSLQMCVV